MKRYKNSSEVKEEHLSKLGSELGNYFNFLYNDISWLHLKWEQYQQLFGTNPSRIDIMNQSASLFFLIIQKELWKSILLHICRLTDSEKSCGKKNLTLSILPNFIKNVEFKNKIYDLIDTAKKSSEFARDWRNRKIAHTDLSLSLNQVTEPLAPAGREQVTNAITAISNVMQQINVFYLKQNLIFKVIHGANDAETLLYVISNGLKAEEDRCIRIHEKKIPPKI